jgi:hypothetical protein
MNEVCLGMQDFVFDCHLRRFFLQVAVGGDKQSEDRALAEVQVGTLR